jgi:choline-sulfatase
MREREHLLHAYGWDDVDEVPGPNATRNTLSHMTARWQSKGLWEAHQRDYEDRIQNNYHVVRPVTLPLEEYYDVYVGGQARQYLQSYNRPEPWFCCVSFPGPHSPWDTPEPYASLHNPEDMPTPSPIPENVAPNRPQGTLDRRLSDSPRIDPQTARELRANYAGNITLIDAQIGEILDVINARGDLSNTVIVFTSDHGEMNGDCGLIKKHNFLNGAVRVPLIVRTPGTLHGPLAGTVHEAPVEWIDVGPTLVELSGGEIGYQQFGRSLCSAFEDPNRIHRDYAISEHEGEIMLLNRDWKMALNKEGQPYLLFNLRQDPGETRNLAGLPEMAEIERDLRLRILERLVESQLVAN